MGLTYWLIAMTAVAVVADTMLLPFYPQYFAERFGVTDPEHIGLYTAAICLVAMLSLPMWARLVRPGGTLRLLLWTQVGAGLLCIACSLTDSLWVFWALSLAMIVFKASYLLIYPYLMEGVADTDHAHTIGLLSIVVHFGHIAGAVLGGMVLAYWPLQHAFLLMAVGDVVQIAVCAGLIRAGLERPAAAQSTPPAGPLRTSPGIHALGLLMLVFYFSEYQIVPFFVEYWKQIAPGHGVQLASWVYAIPAGMGLIALWFNHRIARGDWARGMPLCLLLGLAGLLLQGCGQPAWVLLGRVMFGWASFQLTVRLDALIFERSTPAAYAHDYSKINIYQNVGVLLSYYGAGWLVGSTGLAAPFWLAAGGFVLTLLLLPLLNASPRPLARSTADVLP
ncbi:MFS transporter [Chitinilyticum litopenaei]|uniref:MFS transporter n=1 Tax=Chitinilyticum litopenaei TaxID=1121276 RepID=UPI0004168E16|nr:MFS transporter [Chitinilyticum litopenaei]